MMYADSYMTRDEFRLMFDHTLYDRLHDSPTNDTNDTSDNNDTDDTIDHSR